MVICQPFYMATAQRDYTYIYNIGHYLCAIVYETTLNRTGLPR